MSDSETSDDSDPVLYNCRKCDATVTKKEMESHREFHKGDGLPRRKRAPIKDTHRELSNRNRMSPQTARRTDWPWDTWTSRTFNKLQSTIRRLEKENGKQKQRISSLIKVQETQRSEINALQLKGRHSHSVKQIGELTKEVARLKAQLDNSPQQHVSTSRIMEPSRPPAKKRGKDVSKYVPTPSSRPRTRASAKTGNTTISN